MKLNRLLVLPIWILPLWATAQDTAQNNSYPQDYFRNPLNIPIYLAGNFGECRPGHFHSGIDIKTLGKENQPVHAAADGYVSRIKMEKGGFGHAIYITHPNGYTTLYAHLNKLAPKLQDYVRKEQYKRKRWDIDVSFPAADFPVKKGDQIAWSGNTGASTAPHLHFEIRDSKTEHPLNPELFGLPITDKIAPIPTELVLYYNRHNSVYYANKAFIGLEKKGQTYSIVKAQGMANDLFEVSGDTILTPLGEIGVGIVANDYMDSSGSTLAFYTAKLYISDNLQSQVTLDNIGYDETRYINAYVDYAVRQQQHKWVQCLFKLPGNNLAIYSGVNNTRGWLNMISENLQRGGLNAIGSKPQLRGQRPRPVSLIITDDKGNESKVRFYLLPRLNTDFADGPSMAGGSVHFVAGQPAEFKNGEISFSLDERQLYDDVWFKWQPAKKADAYSAEEHVGNSDIPVHHYFELSVKPDKYIPAELKDKMVMLYTDGKDTDGRAATLTEEGWYKAKVRNFGTYWLAADTTAPVIKSMQRNGSNLTKAERISFEVKEALTSVRSFSGYLDGKWICFEAQAGSYFYEFDEHCPKGKHELVFKAEDENGNSATYSLSFTR